VVTALGDFEDEGLLVAHVMPRLLPLLP